jgi:adenine-specific DNA-methyltransferase
MSRRPSKAAKPDKKVTRYTYNDVKEPRTPETGHTALLPADEQVVTLPMDNGWSKAIEVGKLPEGDERPVVVDMDPAADPILFWAGKRNRREVPVLPLQRNEIVTDSRIAHIIERARRAAAEREPRGQQESLFADLEKTLRESDRSKRVEFYTHEEGWKNKLICGDSLHVMESLLHYEGMRGKVQMIYLDPPYGIKYDSNFQQRVDSTKNEDKDQADDVLTIKAFRDTWSLGIHSYLAYLQERLYMCRELLAETGSVFVQISDDNVHLVRTTLDEVFGYKNFAGLIPFSKTAGQSSNLLPSLCDYLIWYAKDIDSIKYRKLYFEKAPGTAGATKYTSVLLPSGSTRPATQDERDGLAELPKGARLFRLDNLKSQGYRTGTTVEFEFRGRSFHPGADSHWKCTPDGLARLASLNRLAQEGNGLAYIRFINDFPAVQIGNVWTDVGGIQSRSDPKVYVVQTSATVVARAIAMTTDPGDLVFDPTCGSGTTSLCAERLGRRWITCDTSRVAVNVARQRLLGAAFEHYKTVNGKVSGNFKYKTVQRITLSSLAYDLEPEKVELVDKPEVDGDAVRVCGPFEVMSLGRYSVEDWKGYVLNESITGSGTPAKLENYIEVICRLYRKDAAIQGATGLVHAVAETEREKIAISVGPLSGRVTAKQLNDAVQDALASGILEVHVLGWAFEANVGEVKSKLEGRGKVKVELIMIRPDTLAEGLKATQPEMLFSPLALPDIDVMFKKNDEAEEAVVTLGGVALFDRKHRRTEYKRAHSGYVSAWYLDEDYDGDCFVDCQMFFDFKKAPNLKAALKAEIDPQEYKLQLTSQPFPVRGYKRVAVKVVDVYGNESTVVRELS